MKVISIAAVTWLILAAPNSVNAQEWTPKRETTYRKKKRNIHLTSTTISRNACTGGTHTTILPIPSIPGCSETRIIYGV